MLGRESISHPSRPPGTSELNPWEGMGVVCLMEPLASVDLRPGLKSHAPDIVSESLSGHWNHLPLKDHPGFQHRSAYMSHSWPQELKVLKRCWKSSMLSLRFLLFSIHSKLLPELVTCSDVTKAPRVVQGQGFESWFYHLLNLCDS